MDAAHWHLALTHVPVVGAGFALALLAVALASRDGLVRRIALGAVVVVALTALPTYFTGEPAEKIVERLPGVSRRLIHDHEDAAQTAFAGMEIAGGLALLGLLVTARAVQVPRWIVAGMLVVTAVTVGLMAWTANRGGQIRHPEIRTGQAAAARTGESGTAAAARPAASQD